MDRLQISGNVPAHIAERQSDRGGYEPTSDDRALAREELIDRFLSGKTVDRMTLGGLIESELEDNPRRALATLTAHFAGIGSIGQEARLERCQEAAGWMRRLAEEYVDRHTDLIDELAAEFDRGSE